MENDPLATLAPPDPTWNPPPTVPADSMVAAPAAPAAAPPVEAMQPNFTPMIPSETAPNNPDVERHYHEATWRKILDKVGGILGGDTTIHVTKDKDGNVSVTHDPSTSGEKWSRIAATALGGAAQGVANSRGPGGNFRAAAAGTQYGLQAGKEREADADAQATAEQKRQQMNANGAAIQQRLYMGTLEAQALNTKLTKDAGDMLTAYKDEMLKSPDAQDYGTISSEADLMKVAQEHQDFLKQHTRLQLKAIPLPDAKGKVTLHAIATDPGDDMQPTKKGDYLFKMDVDDKGNPVLVKEEVSAGSRKAGELRLANQAMMEKYLKALNDRQKSINDTDKANKDRIPKTAAEAIGQAAMTNDLDEKARLLTAAGKMQESEEALRRAGRSNTTIAMPTGGSTAAQQGAHGDEWLQASGIDPSQWSQIKATARGDVKMPTASRSPQNQVFRNAVMNYDPTFTDARYDTKQNFKTKGDSATLVQLSTAMEHLENAAKNIDYIPLTGKATQYKQDIKLFTQEAGKLVKNSQLTQGEYEDLKAGLDSAFPYVRKAALTELTTLLGGKVGGVFQKYKAGAGSDLPVEEFFDQPTQERLKRYGVIQAPPAADTTAPPTTNGGGAPAKAVPTGKVPAYDKTGAVVGYADDKKGTNYHAF